jgi:Transposase DDE domain
MSQSGELSQWVGVVSSKMPHLSRNQAMVLAMYSFGMVMVQSCGMRSIAYFLGLLLEEKENSVRQRLREWTYEADAKRGQQRKAIEVKACFAPLLKWVLSWWSSEDKRIALAMDASNLRDRFTVLAISVLYRGSAIPVAWVILPQRQKGSWRAEWEDLFEQIKGVIPADWTVIVLADRGLYAKWLYQRIQKAGWHPFLRLNQQGLVRKVGEPAFQALSQIVSVRLSSWSGEVECFKTPSSRLRCTLLAYWDDAHTDPWLIVTDLAPEQASVVWYGMRAWIEAGFKDTKRGGWHWEHTKMSDPSRVERLWLVIAVATLWVLSVGSHAENLLALSSFEALPEETPFRPRPTQQSRPRLLSCFRRGIIRILVALIRREALPLGTFLPLPWLDTFPQRASPLNTYP